MKDWKNHYLTLAPYLVLGLALLATFLSWRALDHAVVERVDQRFREEAEATAHAIETRLHAYELMLRGGLGLFIASDGVSREEFRAYVDILGLKKNYPGIQAFGYIAIVPDVEKPAHEARIRGEGFPEFRVYPEGERPFYGVITYIEPLDARTRRAMGFDVLSERARRGALERARDSGEARITARVRLVQEPQEAPQPGFSMFLPYYKGYDLPVTVEERRARLAGYIYAPFRMYDLMAGILAERHTAANFKIFDGLEDDPDRLMYDSVAAGVTQAAEEQARRHIDLILEIAGRNWTLHFTDSPAFRAANQSYGPAAVGVGGVIVSLALFLLTMMLRRMLTERRLAAEAMVDAEKKLQQAQKMETIGHLTGGVAHDFNNLLQVILGNNDMLMDELGDRPALRAMAAMSRSAAERGAELTHRLLAFARKQPLDPRPTDVNRLVSGMDGLLRRTLGAQIEIETVLAAGAWQALLDAPQMESAILNLCINARDAMPAGGRVTIETANASLDDSYAKDNEEIAPGQYVMVAVSDTGTGMDAATLAKAFEPFFTTKEVGKGSGLGLSMVYGFAKQSKGHVKIYSELGHGTTVRLYLPRAVPAFSHAAPSETDGELPRGTEKVLLVEDDDLVREHVAGQLRSLGYRVVSAANGAAALAALADVADIDLLFTDIVMPGGMNGRQLAEQARALRPDLPVLFTSGYTENAVVHHGRLDSGVQLLQKPYRRHDLARKLRSALAQPVEANAGE